MPRPRKALFTTTATAVTECSALAQVSRTQIMPFLRKHGGKELAALLSQHVDRVEAAVSKHQAEVARLTKRSGPAES